MKDAPAVLAPRSRGSAGKICIGWVERVSLPDLGLLGLKAKVDTGARTSALHVVAVRTLEAAGSSGRPILEVTLPLHSRSGRRPVARVAVREFVDVRDTSGRKERRPVIETKMQLGPLRKRIRVTLTDRGDMRYPMLIGRTALGNDVVVDPVARYLLGGA